MKTKEEIEHLANELIGTQFCGQINITDEVKEFYINGYTQCQKDITDKKYTLEDMKEAFKQSRQVLIFEKDMPPVYQTFEDYINSLNKQD